MMNFQTVHIISKILKKIKLIVVADYILGIHSLIKNRKINRDFLLHHKDFPVPPARLAFDAYGNIHWPSYFDQGVNSSTVISDIINKEKITSNFKVLEWGCGPGRIIRHLRNQLENDVELYGSDYNKKSIKWNQKNIKGIQFIVNQLEPPLSFQPAFFNCVYAISVFTHLSEEMHTQWIQEIERILKPGGLIIITTHGDLTTNRLLSHEKHLYNSGKLVVRGDVKEGKKWYQAYHSPKFVRNNLLKSFDILHNGRFDSSIQDIWVARKKEIGNQFTTNLI